MLFARGSRHGQVQEQMSDGGELDRSNMGSELEKSEEDMTKAFRKIASRARAILKGAPRDQRDLSGNRH